MKNVRIFLVLILITAAVNVCAAEMPDTKIPDFKGRHYETLSPDTIELPQIMQLSINGMVLSVSGPPENPYPPLRYVSDTCTDMTTASPKTLSSCELSGQTMLALLLARAATGYTQGMWVDSDWRAAFIEWQKADPILAGPEGARQLEWMVFSMAREKEPQRGRWNALIEKAVDNLDAAAISYNDGAFIGLSTEIPVDGYEGLTAASLARPDLEARKADILSDVENKRPKGYNAACDAWTVQGLCAVYRETGNKKALNLAGKLARYLKDYAEIIGPDGKFLAVTPGGRVSFHYSFQAALACAEYAATSHNPSFDDFIKQAYRHALSISSPETGWTPVFCCGGQPAAADFASDPQLCSGSDLAQMAYWLSIGNIEDRWEDVERFVRNNISAAQIENTRWAYGLPENKDIMEYPNTSVEISTSRVTGQFGQNTSPNDIFNGNSALVCGTGDTVRTLYYIWKDSVVYTHGIEGGVLYVNTLMNRGTAQADVSSYIPYKGRVEIRIKEDCNKVLVRAPEWVPNRSGSATCTVSKQPVQLSWRGRYMDVGEVKKDQLVVINFPMLLTDVNATIGGSDYVLSVQGNTVIGIKPEGKFIPLYKRDKYMSNKTILMRTGHFLLDRPEETTLKPETYNP